MPETCCAVGCNNRRGDKPGLTFHRFPTDPERRSKWIAAIRREDWQPTEYTRLCGEHFVSGKKSDHPLSPDFTPSIFSFVRTPEKAKSVAAVKKFRMRQAFKERKRNQESKLLAANALVTLSSTSENASDPDQNSTSGDFQHTEENETMTTKGVQTDLTCEDMQRLSLECENLRKENINLREENKKVSLDNSAFEKDDNKVRYYTGLPSYVILMAVFSMVTPHLNENMKLTPFHQLLATLMRLRLGLNVQYLAYTFGVSASTISKVILETLQVLYSRLVPSLIIWPDRDSLRSSLPVSFRSKFRKCACIIDCFEIFTEKASDFNARSQTYSNYKSHNTTKYLIGITPQGVISFISKGWGERTSDKTITENCGFLDMLLPGDLILADRGFDVGDAIGMYAANLSIPAFTKGKKQLNPCDVEATRGLAAVRIHVERVIGMVRQKYSILSSTIPITLLQTDDTGLTTLDKMVHVCSALVNLCEPIIPFD